MAPPIKTEGLVVELVNSGFQLQPVILDDIRPDEVLVEMKYSGICHTDIIAEAGAYPTLDFPNVLGHEGAGIILAVGTDVKDPSLKEGASVILTYNHCGTCTNCSAAHPARCEHFKDLNIDGKRLDKTLPAKLADGRPVVTQFFGQSSFLRKSVVSQHSVVVNPYPEDLAIYSALGCGFQTGAGTILNALKPAPEDSLLVFGVGSVGLAAIMAAKYLQVRQIIAVDLLDEKLELAKELGATHTLNSKGLGDVVQEIRKMTFGGSGVTFAIDCIGATTVLQSMLDCLCCGGTAVIVGVPKADFILKVDPTKMLHENITLRGMSQGDSTSKTFIPEMIRLHRSGHFPLEKLCTFYDIKDIERALADMREGKIIKPILRWT